MPSLGRRDIRGNAIKGKLSATLTTGTMSFNLAADPGASGWPTGGGLGNFTLTFERGTVREERASGSARSALAVTLSERGIDGTSEFEHAADTDVEVTFSGFESDWANLHYSDQAHDHHTQYLNTARHAAIVHTSGMLGTDSVGSAQIQANAVGSSELADNSVDAAAIQNAIIPATKLAAAAFGAVGNITTIDPDDAAAAGATGLIADAGHQHAFTSAAPATLTKTASNTEGAASTHARSDHGHRTDNLPWGTPGSTYRQVLTSNSSAFSGTVNTDFVLSSVSMDATRLYKICCHTNWDISAACTYVLQFTEDATVIGEIAITDLDRWISDAAILIFPTTASHTYRVRVLEVVAGGTITLLATATTPRQFWIEDIGLR